MTLVKYDFINVAAYEGQRYNMTLAPTGMAAYNYGQKLLADAWAGGAFIDYGISLPLPVGPAGHARHQGCEQMNGGVDYSMNQFAGGWWLNQLFLLDPDLVTFQGDYWFRPTGQNWTKIISMDSKSRVAKAVVYGGLFKSGDDLSNATNVALTRAYMGNPRVNAMWATATGPNQIKQNRRSGLKASREGNESINASRLLRRESSTRSTFRPSHWCCPSVTPILPLPPSVIAPAAYTRPNGDVAVFNFAPFERTIEVDVEFELAPGGFLQCTDAWDGISVYHTRAVQSVQGEDGKAARGVLELRVPARASMLLQCRDPAA
jgi:hypothetical protein